MMRRTLTLAAAVVLAGAIGARGSAPVARYRMTDGPRHMPAHLVIRCDSWAEDSAAHLRLVEFTTDRVTYRCARSF